MANNTKDDVPAASAAVLMGDEDNQKAPIAEAIPIANNGTSAAGGQGREQPESPQVRALREQNRNLSTRIFGLSVVLLAVVIGLVVVVVLTLTPNKGKEDNKDYPPPVVVAATTLSPQEASTTAALNSNQGNTQQTFLATPDSVQLPEDWVGAVAEMGFMMDFAFSQDTVMDPTGPTMEDLEGVLAQTQEFLENYFSSQYDTFVALNLTESWALYSPDYDVTQAVSIQGLAQVYFEGEKLPNKSSEAELVVLLNQHLGDTEVLDDFVQEFVIPSPPVGSTIFAQTESVRFSALSGLLPSPFPTPSPMGL